MTALAHPRRRTIPRRRTAATLREGRCMFAVHGDCGRVYSVGLRDNNDDARVLCCERHLPLLRRLRPAYGRRGEPRDSSRPSRDRARP